MAEEKKRPNFFVRAGKKISKLCSDTVGELKKVAWTPRSEVGKTFKLVIATVVAVAAVIMLIDLGSSWLINSIAGLIG
ncbi:MAG: preprotein translocase subunit SecE [Clostridia bacterium]|nr:preprotein translocase subunit SecE [Clostridia bacterium]